MKKKILLSLAVLMVGGLLFTGCRNKDTKQDSADTQTEDTEKSNNEKKEEVALTEDLSEYEDIEWPDSTVAKLIPEPKSMIGKIAFDSDDWLDVEIANTSIDDYKDYVKKCKELGYVENYVSTDDSYMADNKNGYGVIIELDNDAHVMEIMIGGDGSTVDDDIDSADDTDE